MSAEGQQIFAQAVSACTFMFYVHHFGEDGKSLGNQQLEARGAYRNAQQRREDVQQIADTLRELAQLFSDVRNPFYLCAQLIRVLTLASHDSLVEDDGGRTGRPDHPCK